MSYTSVSKQRQKMARKLENFTGSGTKEGIKNLQTERVTRAKDMISTLIVTEKAGKLNQSKMVLAFQKAERLSKYYRA